MPRLSLWKEGRHTNDYRFFDRRISEMFTIGGTGVLVHKYLGPVQQTGSTDSTKPDYVNQSELNIQDLLFLENRDRKYDSDVYALRGIYQVADQDFDLSQFGLFLATGTLFMNFHLNDMIDTLGRKLMNGDVLELVHLKDYTPLDETLPLALKRYYVISDASRASEGYSPTWWAHLWRVKLNPLVDSQEYKDILNKIQTDADGNSTGNSLSDLLSTYDKYSNINDAIIDQAEKDVPKSGYDTTQIYHKSADGEALVPDADDTTDGTITADSVIDTADEQSLSPSAVVAGWLTGDGIPPNGYPVASGISFPTNPTIGDYYLRLDYLPNRLFRFDSKRWVKIEDNVRTNLTPGPTNLTQRSIFVNNADTVRMPDGTTKPAKVSLSQAFKPLADN
jgi:hypothetical protein